MPALRVCSVSGCPNTTPAGGRCGECRASADAARGTAAARGYNTAAHKRFRRSVLLRDPVCTLCAKALSIVADHWPLSRRELIDAQRDPNDPVNGRGLCKRCHDKETARHQPGGWHVRSR